MAISEITEAKPVSDHKSRWIGIYVGVLAVLLAICTMGGGNAAKDAMRAHLEAANTWAFFQAKNIRRSLYAVAADDLDLLVKANPAMPSEARAAMEAKIKTYRADVERYSSDKKTNEGLDELFQKAKEIETERDTALRKDPYFDLSQALLQIAIVLASVALIADMNVLLGFSIVLGAAGTALMVNGFLLLAKLPMLG